MKKHYTLKAKLWVYPGVNPWHFLTVSKKASKEIKEQIEKNVRGFGSVPVSVTIGDTTWNTSIFPDKKSGTYLLPVKAQVRTAEDIIEDDTVSYSLTLR